MANTWLVLTGSRGIQEETTILGVPWLTLRKNSERPVTVTQGTNMVAAHDPGQVVAEALAILGNKGKAGRVPELWDGRAAERIVRIFASPDGQAREPRGWGEESVSSTRITCPGLDYWNQKVRAGIIPSYAQCSSWGRGRISDDVLQS